MVEDPILVVRGYSDRVLITMESLDFLSCPEKIVTGSTLIKDCG